MCSVAWEIGLLWLFSVLGELSEWDKVCEERERKVSVQRPKWCALQVLWECLQRNRTNAQSFQLENPPRSPLAVCCTWYVYPAHNAILPPFQVAQDEQRRRRRRRRPRNDDGLEMKHTRQARQTNKNAVFRNKIRCGNSRCWRTAGASSGHMMCIWWRREYLQSAQNV